MLSCTLQQPELKKGMREVLAAGLLGARCVIKLVQLGQGALCSQERQARGRCWHGNPS